MNLEVPYRITTEKELFWFITEFLSQLTVYEIIDLELYIRNHSLINNHFNNYLPEVVELKIFDSAPQQYPLERIKDFTLLKKKLHWFNVSQFVNQQITQFKTRINYLPSDLMKYMRQKSRQILDLLTTINRTTNEENLYNIHSVRIEFQKLFIKAIKQYIATKNQMLEKLLTETVSELMYYNLEEEKLDTVNIGILENHEIESFEKLQILSDFYQSRDSELYKLYFKDLRLKLIETHLRKIEKENISHVVIKSISEDFDSLKSRYENVEYVKKMAEAEIYPEVKNKNLREKYLSFVYNCCDQIHSLDGLFSKGSDTSALFSANHYYNHCTEQPKKGTEKEQRLTLHKCKDYGELLKGFFPRDCSTRNSLAVEHFETPNFLNYRIFHEENWIGNMYILNFLERDRTILIDRIQVDKYRYHVPDNFFRQMIVPLIKAFSECLDCRLLAPLRISDDPRIQAYYELYLQEEQVETIYYPLVLGEYIFESQKCKRFYILFDNI